MIRVRWYAPASSTVNHKEPGSSLVRILSHSRGRRRVPRGGCLAYLSRIKSLQKRYAVDDEEKK
jgi:hypothetical protein